VPVSAYPLTAYAPAGYPVLPPPTARTSPWVWVLTALSALLFLTAGGLGYGYYTAYAAVVDRNATITDLQRTVSEREATIQDQDAEIAGSQDDLDSAQACIDAVEAILDPGLTVEEFNILFDEMREVCGFDI
jgi:alkanesulfonate monooxygenase SsuD/methylene tetrahydromethanopterin reductase-like flavin-dependent oxidoreductase (luciferase family)